MKFKIIRLKAMFKIIKVKINKYGKKIQTLRDVCFLL